MNFNMLDAVAAGTGFIQGQDQQHQIDLQNQQQQAIMANQRMATLMNQLKLQDEQRNVGYAQGESAYARQIATDPDTMDLPVDKKMDLMANAAFKQGDLVRGNEFAVNATNFRNTQAQVEERQAMAQAKIEASQEKLFGYMGNQLANAADPKMGGSEAKFNEVKMQLQAEGLGTPQDQQRLASLKWDPNTADRLRYGAMTAAQVMQDRREQQRIDIDAKNKESLEVARKLRQQLAEEKLAHQKELEEIKAKVGADKPITKEELAQAEPYLKDMGLDPNDESTLAVQQDIVGTARQLIQSNKNMSLPQAYQQAADLIKKTDIKPITRPVGGWGSGTKEVGTLKMRGITPQDAIDASTITKADTIPGRYYTKGGKLYQRQGMEMVPVQQ